ncbi:uncharacterized protein V6R79_005744 [Siganus canaliculatus]
MGDSLSSHLNSWVRAQNSTLEESHSEFMNVSLVLLVPGVVVFVCLFSKLYKRRKTSCSENDQLEGFQDVHTTLPLLTMDVVHIAVTSFYFIDFSQGFVLLGPHSCLLINSVWILSRYFMVIVHLITALMSICFLRDPPSKGKLRLMAPLTLVLFLIFAAVYLFLTPYIVIILGLVAIGLIVTIRLKNPGLTKRTTHIVSVSTMSLVIAFLPSFFFNCFVITHMISGSQSIYLHVQFFTNFQLMFDAMLCYLSLVLPMKEDGETTNYYGGCCGDIHFVGGGWWGDGGDGGDSGDGGDGGGGGGDGGGGD